jgi:DNA-binding MarR family transcriptional regulator
LLTLYNGGVLACQEREQPLSDSELFVAHVPGIRYGVLDALMGYAIRRAQIKTYESFIMALEPWGITPPRFSAMVIVSLNRGLKLTQLAKIMGIARSGAVILVDALEELGYMERQPAPEDRRAFSLALTDKGRADLEKITEVAMAQDRCVVAPLSQVEQGELHRLLLKLCGIAD